MVMNDACTLFESHQIYFDEFVERIEMEYSDIKEAMYKRICEIETESYVMNEASLSEIFKSIGTFVMTIVNKIVSAAKTFARVASDFIRDLIRKDTAEKTKGTFDMSFNNDPFRFINEVVIDYRNIDTVMKSDKMTYINPFDVPGSAYQDFLDAVSAHKEQITGGFPDRFDDKNTRKYEEYLFGTTPLTGEYVPHDRCVAFFNKIQDASNYTNKQAIAFKAICEAGIIQFNNAVANETDATLIKYFNDVKNGIGKVMDFDMTLHAKQMQIIKNALNQSARIQSIWVNGNR